mmetsp:Transcript_24674/g.68809  ORF Transcript_24674/g.68809 Transcript_24674/m.68809 type:complete len:468 (-) Transcript_24674:8-1411(-)
MAPAKTVLRKHGLKERGLRAAHADCAALELRALLPKLWRHFYVDRVAAGAANASGVQVASMSVHALRSWLRETASASSQWERASLSALRQALQAAVRLPHLRRGFGFRFKDPSKHGTWGANNLVGYKERPLKRSRQESEVSWDNYMHAYKLRFPGKEAVEVSLEKRREVVSCRVEKRRRCDPGGPLASEVITVTAHSRCAQAGDRRRKIRIVHKTADLLPAVIVRPPSGQQRWTLIYLHGLGSSAMENYSDRPHYFVDGSIAMKVVVPTAPARELSCYDTWWQRARSPLREKGAKPKLGWALKKFLSWYDYLSNHDGAREDALDSDSLLAMRRALHSLVLKEARELGGQTNRVILGGKSQGCCTALDAALTFSQPLGGFIGIVGHLLSCTPVEPNGPQANIPLHLFHEPQDEMMRWSWVRKGEERLREAGYHVLSRHCPDPEDHGHFVEGVEGNWIRSALRLIDASR